MLQHCECYAKVEIERFGSRASNIVSGASNIVSFIKVDGKLYFESWNWSDMENIRDRGEMSTRQKESHAQWIKWKSPEYIWDLHFPCSWRRDFLFVGGVCDWQLVIKALGMYSLNIIWRIMEIVVDSFNLFLFGILVNCVRGFLLGLVQTGEFSSQSYQEIITLFL